LTENAHVRFPDFLAQIKIGRLFSEAFTGMQSLKEPPAPSFELYSNYDEEI
jgi:hypothetical protein